MSSRPVLRKLGTISALHESPDNPTLELEVIPNSPDVPSTARLLHHTIRERADRDPSAAAVVAGDERLEYGQLMESALRLATVLRDIGVRPGDRVCLLVPKSPSAIIGILGTLCAGAVYVPLDPSSPASRIRKILASCDDRWILAGGRVGGLVSEIIEDPPGPDPVVG